MQVHARYALDACGEDVNGDSPFLVSQVGTVHQGVSLDREELAASPASVRHVGMLGSDLYVIAIAVSATNTVPPTD